MCDIYIYIWQFLICSHDRKRVISLLATKPRNGQAWPGLARPGQAWPGLARPGKALVARRFFRQENK